MTGLVHDAFVYSHDQEYATSMASFLREGLERGEAVVAVTVPANAVLLRDALGSARDDLRFVDARTWYAHPPRTVATYSDLFRDMLGDGATRLRVVGEVQFGATTDEHDDWACYESALNHVFADLPGWIVCPYDTRALPASVVESAAVTHPHVTDSSGRTASTRYDAPARFVGRAQSLGAMPSRAPDVDLVLEEGLPAMRRSILDAACTRGRDDTLVEPFVLAANEVATNALVHGGGHGRVRLWVDDRELLCVVSDAGHGLDDALAGFTPPSPGRVGGRGLWIARQVCDSVRIGRAPDGGFAVALRSTAR
jgi:anti-sigma regulatory factor (Ser/Thr protein kinase)